MLPLPYTEDEYRCWFRMEDRKERPMHDTRHDAKEIPIKQAQEERMEELYNPIERQEIQKGIKPNAPEIKGYRKLSIHEVEAINNIKYLGIEIGRMCDKVEKMHDIDKLWFAIGRAHLQQGLMAITRAIAKPETF